MPECGGFTARLFMQDLADQTAVFRACLPVFQDQITFVFCQDQGCVAVLSVCPVSYTHLDVYKRQVLDGESMRDTVYNMITEFVENTTDRFVSPDVDMEDADLGGLERTLHEVIPQLGFPKAEELKKTSQKELKHLDRKSVV